MIKYYVFNTIQISMTLIRYLFHKVCMNWCKYIYIFYLNTISKKKRRKSLSKCMIEVISICSLRKSILPQRYERIAVVYFDNGIIYTRTCVSLEWS